MLNAPGAQTVAEAKRTPAACVARTTTRAWTARTGHRGAMTEKAGDVTEEKVAAGVGRIADARVD